MAKVERMRDPVPGELSADLFQRRTGAGWRMAAVEWQRELPGSDGEEAQLEPVPYGLRISKDCQYLEVDPHESEILMVVMDKIVQEEKLPSIARELNDRGYRTRRGAVWTESAVFELMPRLIDSGPRMFNSKLWIARQTH